MSTRFDQSDPVGPASAPSGIIQRTAGARLSSDGHKMGEAPLRRAARMAWTRRTGGDGLPPSQRFVDAFPRFSDRPLHRAPVVPDDSTIGIDFDGRTLLQISGEHIDDAREQQVADFHCVTTWSIASLRWSGVPLTTIWERVIAAEPTAAEAKYLTVHGFDRYFAVFMLEDLLQPDALIADRLDGEPLGLRHGAPFRLVSPSQYGIKSVKHVARIELHRSQPRRGLGRKEHLRSRVQFQERHGFLPAWSVRWFYRAAIPVTALLSERSLARGVWRAGGPKERPHHSSW